MKLELKHLAPYLPYELLLKGNIESWKMTGDNISYVEQVQAKPILRPLSDLVNEINVDGKRFIPIEHFEAGSVYRDYKGVKTSVYISYDLCGETFTDAICIGGSIKDTDYKYVELLLKWHFDVFRLIEDGLAINMNDIK
jgi:hypothetical protein